MAIPELFRGRITLPVIAAPMFLVSGPDLVVETCKAGVVGSFPALNQRSTEGYGEWLAEIRERTGNAAAPFGVNLIVHRSNARLDADLAETVRQRVPFVITSLGAVSEVVDAIHGYGGLVFHDVINLRHARKAAEAGVDGLIAVCAGSDIMHPLAAFVVGCIASVIFVFGFHYEQEKLKIDDVLGVWPLHGVIDSTRPSRTRTSHGAIVRACRSTTWCRSVKACMQRM